MEKAEKVFMRASYENGRYLLIVIPVVKEVDIQKVVIWESEENWLFEKEENW